MKSLTIVLFVAIIAYTYADECTSGTSKQIDCNQCNCNNGVWACTQKACLPRSKRETAECSEGETTMNDCNTCRCVKGGWACTRRACPKVRRETRCNPGESFKQDCNTCRCSADGRSAACTFAICPPQQPQH